MRRLALLLVATVAVVIVLVTVRATEKPMQRRPAALSSPTPTASTGTTAGTHRSGGTPSSNAPPLPLYRSGTATGAAHTDYGDVRVRVTVARGRIVKIVAVELPHANQTDRELSWPAARTLERAALRAQSADVDVVSGATYTSTGYLTSLQAALDRLS
jgi:uncharacterized protein with FMN-binding domain